MKKNGFTLVELLAVIIILAILYLFVMPKVTDLIKNGNKTDEYIIQNKIITAAKEYTSNYDTHFLNDVIYIGYSKYISKEDLINNKLLDENEVESIGFFKVKVTLKEDNKLEYSISYDTESEKVILSVNLDGGSMISNPSGEYDVGSTIILNTPTKTDYEFSHWSIEVGNSILSGNMLTIGNINTTIKANWIKKITLTIDLNGGTSNNQGGIYSSNSTITLKEPTKDNYVFAGWKLVSGDAVLSGNKLTLGLQDASVKALWVQGTYEFAYTGSEQTFTAPASGYYKLEAWGAQGGSYSASYYGGYGGYSTGIVFLNKNEQLKIYVGGTTTSSSGGYNGGGEGSSYVGNSGGGGATHIARVSGLLSTLSEKRDNILIVAGGGGGSYYESGSGYVGGSAGGYIGNNGLYNKRGVSYGGTQVSGGTNTDSSSYSGSFGKGGTNTNFSAGGGSGLYGGSAGGTDRTDYGDDYGTGAGGSGYIGNELLTDKVMYCYNCTASFGTDTKTISRTCVNETATENCSKKGNGYTKITFIKEASEDTRIVKNKEFDNINREQTFTAPVSGYYKLEAWGAQGGSYSASYYGGYGGYSTGTIYLNKNDVLRVYVGGTATSSSGGYNGGGEGSSYVGISGGGGATHIARVSGLLSTLSEKRDNILIVAGGGGGSYYESGSGYVGGSAGGYIGNNGLYNKRGVSYGGTQVSGGTNTDSSSYSGSFGKGGTNTNFSAGGGSGLYGGSAGGTDRTDAGDDYGTGAGGSGYIGNTLLTNKVMYCYNCTASSEEATKTISTTCVNEAATENCAKKGNGYAKITYVGE